MLGWCGVNRTVATDSALVSKMHPQYPSGHVELLVMVGGSCPIGVDVAIGGVDVEYVMGATCVVVDVQLMQYGSLPEGFHGSTRYSKLELATGR